MRRADRKHEICFESLEEALAKSPETYGHIDVLCAGWPCQDNSTQGTRKGHEGKKSGLWREVKRLLKLFRPKWFIGENVSGLFSVNGGKDFWQVLSDLDSLGYCVAWDVLDSRNFGLAQRRKRIFIVGSLGNIGAAKVLFEPEEFTGNITKAKHKEALNVSLSLSTRSGARQSGTDETYIFSSIKTTNSLPGASQRGTQNLIADVYPKRKGKITRTTGKLDSRRGIVIGNAVSVPVAEWIGRRIMIAEKRLSQQVMEF